MLLTLDEYKEYKDINPTETEYDAHYNKLIAAVSSFIKRYCGRVLESDTVIEYFDARQQSVQLKEYPVNSVTQIETSVDGVTFEILDSADYVVINEEETIISRNPSFLSNPEIPQRSGKITYSAGLVVIPEDLKLACVHLVDYYLNNEFKPSKAFEGVNVENPTAALRNNLPHHIKRVLDQYRAL